MRERVSLFIVRNGQILMMRRRRNGRLYHVFIGGGIEPGESLVQAAHREAKEETSLDIVLGLHLWTRELFIARRNKSPRTCLSGHEI